MGQNQVSCKDSCLCPFQMFFLFFVLFQCSYAIDIKWFLYLLDPDIIYIETKMYIDVPVTMLYHYVIVFMDKK